MTVLKRYELARVYTPTIGTSSPLTLGAAVPGYLLYATAGVQNGDLIPYCIRDGVASEVGSGIYSSTGPTLTRNVIKSTNSDNPINLTGLAEVFIGPRAADFGTGANQALLLDDTGKIPAIDGTQITGVVKTAGDTMTGDLTIAKTNARILLSATGSNDYAVIGLQNGGLFRWDALAGGVESGGNSGADFWIRRYNDAGSAIDTPFTITRGYGSLIFGPLANQSPAPNVPQVSIKDSGSVAALGIMATAASVSSYAALFYNSVSTNVGSIVHTDSATSFGTSSDGRLKKNDQPFTRGREILDRLSIKEFQWVNTDADDIGVIAQEVVEAYPQAIIKGRSEPNEPDFIPWGVDYSKYVPLLIQALQDAFREIDALKAQLGK